MNYHRDRDYIENERLFGNIFRTRFNLVAPYIKNIVKGKVLDIGCSNGVFLDLFKSVGWETWGVEPSGNHKIARSKGHKVSGETIEEALVPKNYFDLVIMNHTLEHLEKPGEVMKKVHGLLKVGGVVLVDVPNAGGLGARVLGKHWPLRLPEEHLSQFTKDSLSGLFKESGLTILKFKSRSGIFEYASPLAELRRKRFLIDILTIPYSVPATLLNIGDSMSLIGRRDT